MTPAPGLASIVTPGRSPIILTGTFGERLRNSSASASLIVKLCWKVPFGSGVKSIGGGRAPL
jgi:hypothetical protein